MTKTARAVFQILTSQPEGWTMDRLVLNQQNGRNERAWSCHGYKGADKT
ncbi:hypothetical protein ACSN6S_001218 [Escherichia coli]